MFLSSLLGEEHPQQDLQQFVGMWISLTQDMSRCAAKTIITRKTILTIPRIEIRRHGWWHSTRNALIYHISPNSLRLPLGSVVRSRARIVQGMGLGCDLRLAHDGTTLRGRSWRIVPEGFLVNEAATHI